MRRIVSGIFPWSDAMAVAVAPLAYARAMVEWLVIKFLPRRFDEGSCGETPIESASESPCNSAVAAYFFREKVGLFKCYIVTPPPKRVYGLSGLVTLMRVYR